jgi:uncharacterized membrane protein
VARQEIASEDRSTYSRVGYTLLGGLWLSIAVMVLGLLVAGAQGKKEPTLALPLSQEWSQLTAGNPSALVDLGILLLFAAPLLGVLVALFEFLRRREMTFIAITVALVIILILGFAVALH